MTGVQTCALPILSGPWLEMSQNISSGECQDFSFSVIVSILMMVFSKEIINLIVNGF